MEGAAEDTGKQDLATAAKDPAATSFADSTNSLAHAEAASPVHAVQSMREIRAFLRVPGRGGRVLDARVARRASRSVPDLYRKRIARRSTAMVSSASVGARLAW